jgi:hypothetical protein
VTPPRFASPFAGDLLSDLEGFLRDQRDDA